MSEAEMPVPCPCCGRPLLGQLTVEETIVAAGLSKFEATIMRTLARAKGQWLTSYDIAGVVYADHPQGGPVNVQSSLSRHFKRLRAKLQKAEARLAVEASTAPGTGRRLLAVLQSRTANGFRWGEP